MKRPFRILLVTALFFSLGTGFSSRLVLGDDVMKTRQLVDKAQLTLQAFITDPNMAAFLGLFKQARGVLIAPQVFKGAFILGASGGSGVLLARAKPTASWNGPAFYTIGEVSFGLQIGGEASELVLLAMTERGVTAFLGNSFKLGGDIGIAAGPVGIGASAASANLSADILSFSRSKGLYGGISLEGAVVAVRRDWNRTYYGKEVNPVDIFILRNVKNPQAAGLIEAAKKAASP